LSAAVPWEVVVCGGAARIDVDLSGLRPQSFKVDGGVHTVTLTLPESSGTVPVRIEGGTSSVRVRRPKSVAARLHVGSGASNLALDGQRLGAVGGETTMENPGYAGATHRYEITITGGADDVPVLTA